MPNWSFFGKERKSGLPGGLDPFEIRPNIIVFNVVQPPFVVALAIDRPAPFDGDVNRPVRKDQTVLVECTLFLDRVKGRAGFQVNANMTLQMERSGRIGAGRQQDRPTSRRGARINRLLN